MTNKQELRERYSEKPAPKCHICGSVMSIQRAGGGSVVYGCTGRIDEEGEGYKFEAGRGFADDHYARSRVTDYSPSGDPDVLALLDELEAKDKRIAEMKELLQWSHDTLLEINPSNYTHDDVCEANAAAVEVILGIAPTLGETHGKTKEWWESRAASSINGEG